MSTCIRCHALLLPDGGCPRCDVDETLIGEISPFEPRPGARVGAYRLCERLDQGAMGEVWRGEHATLHDDGPHRLAVAIKLMLPAVAARPGLRDRFKREARAHARIEHPSIPRFYDYDEVGGRPYLVMALVEGPTLKQHIAGRALPIAEARAIGAQLAGCLDHLHRNEIVHRDLKPANVKLKSLDPIEVVVLDLGICKALGDWDDSLGTQAMLGTPAYVAPEMLGDVTRVAASADQFALGVMLYEMLTGKRPFTAPTVAGTLARIQTHTPPPPSLVRADGAIDRALDALVMRLLDKTPARRFADMATVEAHLSDREVPERAPPSTSTLAAPTGRPSWWQIVQVASGVLVAGLGLAAYTCDRRPPERLGDEPTASITTEQPTPPTGPGEPAGRAEAEGAASATDPSLANSAPTEPTVTPVDPAGDVTDPGGLPGVEAADAAPRSTLGPAVQPTERLEPKRKPKRKPKPEPTPEPTPEPAPPLPAKQSPAPPTTEGTRGGSEPPEASRETQPLVREPPARSLDALQKLRRDLREQANRAESPTRQ